MSQAIPVVDDPLFFLDYDGTLAPIVDDPDAAVPHPEVPDLLRALDDEYPVWIVTGRHLQALAQFLDQPLNAIGLHGAQEGRVGESARHLASEEAIEAMRRLRATVPEMEGLHVEEKDTAFAIHYRAAADEEEARQRINAWADTVPEMLDAIWGKDVMELRPKGLTKGTAVRRIAQQHPDRAPVYLGDDVTDEDAFEALAGRDEAVTVKIGSEDTAAQYRLEGPDEVVSYLRQYV